MTEDNRNENINNEDSTQNKEWADELHLDSWPPVAPEPEQPVTPPPFSAEKAEEQKPAPFINPKFTQPMQPENMEAPEPMPSTYLVWSVLATVLCCIVPGIIAILYSTKVTSRYYAKDYEGAKKASEYAQYWIIGSIVIGLVVQTVYLPLMLLV